jgi:hypothetical protein
MGSAPMIILYTFGEAGSVLKPIFELFLVLTYSLKQSFPASVHIFEQFQLLLHAITGH